MKKSIVLLWIALLAGGCGEQPTAPSASQVGPPKAVLIIDSGGSTPPLGISGFTPFVFDARQSTGDGLSYSIDYGDGASATGALTSHVGTFTGLRATAKLTVTDRFGRADSTSAEYFVARIATIGTDAWGVYQGPPYFGLHLQQEGSQISGWYYDNSTAPPFVVSRKFSGTLSGAKTVHLVSDDGVVEMTGTLEWRQFDPAKWGFGPLLMEQIGTTLRMTVHGVRGAPDGAMAELVFHFGD